MSQDERPRRKESPLPTFSLKKYPDLYELFQIEEIVFPRGIGPKGKWYKDLRTTLAQYWAEGGLDFIRRFKNLRKGKRLREEIDWGKDEFQLKLREFGEIIGFSRGHLKNTRKALLVGRLMEKEEGGEEGIWVFTREELLQLAVAAHVYPRAVRKYLGKKH